MEKNIPRFTGDFAKSYEKNLGPFLFEPFAKDLANRVNKNSTVSILEIASGTGRVTKHLRKNLPLPVKISATDISEDMLAIAKELLKDHSIEFLTADAQDLPYDDNSFDTVICQFGIMFFPDKPKAMSEAYRVLKPGGVMLFNTWDKIENNPLVHTSHKFVNEFFKNDPPAFYKIPFSMYDRNELSELMTNAGFKNIEIEYVTLKGVSENSNDLVHGLIKGNPIYNEILDKDPEAPDRIVTELEKEISKLFGSKPVVSDLSAWICKGVK
ncbi:MAG TPA: class I SAM-dependent methyltransferase [Ignavibacteria bacterium]|nr:class I SAM-dependent methyltransferase [Ignavibacteria bacterium]